MVADHWSPTIERWVDAAPFGPLLEQLSAECGIDPTVVGVGINVPLRTIETLLGPRDNRPKRIRWIDAFAISSATGANVRRSAAQMIDTEDTLALLDELPFCLRDPHVLREELCIDLNLAMGLSHRWAQYCPAIVAWRAEILVSHHLAGLLVASAYSRAA